MLSIEEQKHHISRISSGIGPKVSTRQPELSDYESKVNLGFLLFCQVRAIHMSALSGHDTEGTKAQAGRFHSTHFFSVQRNSTRLGFSFRSNGYRPDEKNKHCKRCNTVAT